jgi:hypothetical protein
LRSQKSHGRVYFLRLSKPLHRHILEQFVRELIEASFGSPVLSRIGVTIGPGATAFTRMPRPTSSAAAVLARERIAAFVAEYVLAPGWPVWPAGGR